MTAMRIIPCFDEIKDGGFGFLLRSETVLDEELAFKRCVEVFAHRVIEAVAARTHRWTNAGGFATKAKCNRRVLRSLIRVMHHGKGFSTIDRHLERINDEFLTHVVSHSPANNTPAEDVKHDGQIQETAPRRNVRYVSDPQCIGSIGDKASLDEIGCRSRVAITNRRNGRFASRSPVDIAIAHQMGNALAANTNAVIDKFRMNSRTSIRRTRSTEDRFDPISEQNVALLMCGRRSSRPRVESTRRNVEHAAHYANGIFGLIRFHESEDLFGNSVLSRSNQAAAPSLSIHAARDFKSAASNRRSTSRRR